MFSGTVSSIVDCETIASASKATDGEGEEGEGVEKREQGVLEASRGGGKVSQRAPALPAGRDGADMGSGVVERGGEDGGRGCGAQTMSELRLPGQERDDRPVAYVTQTPVAAGRVSRSRHGASGTRRILPPFALLLPFPASASTVTAILDGRAQCALAHLAGRCRHNVATSVREPLLV